MLRLGVFLLFISISNCGKCLGEVGEYFSTAFSDYFDILVNSIDIPSIDDLFQDEITPDKLMESINQIQDKDLQAPVKNYIEEVDELSTLNSLYQIQTEKKEMDGLFDNMSENISKIEKYKNVKTGNPEKMDKLKEKFAGKTLAYAAKQLKKEEQQQKNNETIPSPVLIRTITSDGTLGFAYNGDTFGREIDTTYKKEYIVYDLATQWGFIKGSEETSETKSQHKLNLTKVLEKLSPINNKIKMEVRTDARRKAIVALVYKGPGNQYATFSVVQNSDIQAYNNWGLGKIIIHEFLRQNTPDFSKTSDNTAKTIWYCQPAFTKQGGDWSQLNSVSVSGTHTSDTGTSTGETYVTYSSPKKDTSYFIKNFISSTKGYELLWMNLSCCCYKKSTFGSATSFGKSCSDVNVCDSDRKNWWSTKKFTPIDNTFTSDTSEQATGVGTPGVICGTIIKGVSSTRCIGQLSYKPQSGIQLRDQYPNEIISAGPLTSIGSAPYMLALRWSEFFAN